MFSLFERAVADDAEPVSQGDSQIEELELEIAKLKGVQSAMPDPYYIRDMDYNITLWPESIAKLTGFSEAEAKRLKCYDIFRACVCPPVAECPTQQCVIDRQFLRDVAVDVYHKRGHAIASLVSNAGIYDKNGEPIGAVEIVKDNSAVKKTMDSISKSIQDIEKDSSKLDAAIERVSSVSEKVKDNADRTLDGVKTGVQAGGGVSEKAKEGTKHAVSVQSGMETINKSMQFTVEKILGLKKNADAISKFVTVIQDIASKTNLLAINASIEAAHAGESGRGFKVVADGIRELSKNSTESAQSIQGIIHEMNGSVGAASSSLNVTENDIELGTQKIAELLTFFSEIDVAVKLLLDTMGRIEKAAFASSEVVSEQNASVEEISAVGHDLSGITQKLTGEVYQMIGHTKM